MDFGFSKPQHLVVNRTITIIYHRKQNVNGKFYTKNRGKNGRNFYAT